MTEQLTEPTPEAAPAKAKLEEPPPVGARVEATIVGGQIVVHGTGFSAGEEVDAMLSRPDGTDYTTRVVANADGEWSSYARFYGAGEHRAIAKRSGTADVASETFGDAT
jgi:2-polyprenyl-6-methoxyphenol hydroxylase-like FAD-dependent oxidoreductase